MAPAETAAASAEAETAPAEVVNSFCRSCNSQIKLQITLAEAETPSVEAETIPARFAVAPAVIPEKLIKLISPSLVKS